MTIFFDDKTKESARDIIASGLIGSIPAVGPALVSMYSLRSLLMNRAQEIKAVDCGSRLGEFHTELVNDGNCFKVDDSDEFYNDYILAIEKTLRDEESSKAKYYARLLKSFSTIKRSKYVKIILIKILKQLDVFDIVNLQRSYIHENNEIKSASPAMFNEYNDISIDKLLHSSLISKDIHGIRLSKLGNSLVKSLFSEDELKPIAIDGIVWKKTQLTVNSYSAFEEPDNTQKYGDVAHNILKDNDFRCPFLSLNSKNPPPQPLIPVKLFLVYDNTVRIDEFIEKKDKLCARFVIKVHLTDTDKADPLDFIEGVNVFYYRSKINLDSFTAVMQNIYVDVLQYLD